MKKLISLEKLVSIPTLQSIFREEAIRRYNSLDEGSQLDLKMQYDCAKFHRQIQQMGGTFEDFLRQMFDLKVYYRKKDGHIECKIKLKNRPYVVLQKLEEVKADIRMIKEELPIFLTKYNDGEIPFYEFSNKFKSCKSAITRIQLGLMRASKIANLPPTDYPD
jgi:hypothetical protein